MINTEESFISMHQEYIRLVNESGMPLWMFEVYGSIPPASVERVEELVRLEEGDNNYDRDKKNNGDTLNGYTPANTI